MNIKKRALYLSLGRGGGVWLDGLLLANGALVDAGYYLDIYTVPVRYACTHGTSCLAAIFIPKKFPQRWDTNQVKQGSSN